MKVSTFWGICTIILLLLIIGYYYRFSIIHNTNYEPFDVNIMNRNDGQRVFTPSTTKSVDDHRSSDKFGHSVPFTFGSILDNTKPTGYQESDLKSIYLSREQLDARRIAPIV